jgi:hypothetical protein
MKLKRDAAGIAFNAAPPENTSVTLLSILARLSGRCKNSLMREVLLMQQASLDRIESVWRGSNAIIIDAVAMFAFSSLFPVRARAGAVSTSPKLDFVLPAQLCERRAN